MDAAALLKLHEGFRAKPYTCTAGKLTIGYGRNLEDRGITEKEAAYLLQNDIDEALKSLRLESYWTELNEARQAALIDMCVNLGWPRLSRFEKMRAALAAGDFIEAGRQARDSAWFRQVGLRSERLARMIETGGWPRGVPS